MVLSHPTGLSHGTPTPNSPTAKDSILPVSTGIGSSQYPAPILVAYLAAVGEIVIPVLLVIGFRNAGRHLRSTRMAAIIQLTIPSGWQFFTSLGLRWRWLLWSSAAVTRASTGF